MYSTAEKRPILFTSSPYLHHQPRHPATDPQMQPFSTRMPAMHLSVQTSHQRNASINNTYNRLPLHLQLPLLPNLLIRLDLIALLETIPPLKAHPAFRPLAHLRHVLLHVLQGVDGACVTKVVSMRAQYPQGSGIGKDTRLDSPS